LFIYLRNRSIDKKEREKLLSTSANLEIAKPVRNLECEAAAVDQIKLRLPALVLQRKDGLPEVG
jgi:hypothetical protein